MAGKHIIIEGLYFRNVTPAVDGNPIVSFRRNSKRFAYNSTLVNCLFENCNPPDPKTRYPWVRMYGRENTVDRCRFMGQNHSGVTIQINLNEANANHRILRSHFLDRARGRGNGFEMIQVGQSQDSMKVGGCLIEDNIFERCDGETEIVSVKSCENIVRHNLFLKSSGTLTLRHGNRNVAENNIFYGDNKNGSGGVRVIGEDHRISGNYFQNLNGRTGGVVVLYTGIPDSPLNGYTAAHRAIVENNIFLNNQSVAIYLNGGYGRRGRTIPAEDIQLTGNVIQHAPGGGSAALGGSLPGEMFSNNVYDTLTELGRPDNSGFRNTSIKTEPRVAGLQAAIIEGDDGASRTIEPPAPLNYVETGPTWHSPLNRMVLWNKDRLIDFRHDEDSQIVEARNWLIEEANRLVDEAKTYSVTFNERTPPSGDIRDYYSTGPYWWPNPDTEDGLPYVRRDGEFNPERDRVSDRDPLRSMVRDTRLCALAYFVTGDERFADHALDVVRTWFLDPVTGMRPNLNHAQAIPGKTDGRGTGIIDAHPFAELVDALLILERSPAMSDDEKMALHTWFDSYIEWMDHHPNGHHERKAKNNHGTAFDLQLAGMCRYVERDLQVKDILERSVIARIDSQLAEDGTQPHELSRTRTWSYCTENLEHFFKLGAIGLQSGINIFDAEGEDGVGLHHALDYLTPYVCTPSDWPHRQDTEWQEEFILNILAIAKGLYADSRYSQAKACLSVPAEKQLLAYLLTPNTVSNN
jgi:hypothetical protein